MRNIFLLYLSGFVATIASSCQPSGSTEEAFERNVEAREDSLEFALAVEANKKIAHRIYPLFETTPVNENPSDDAADDPAFWKSPVHPDSSLIFGTNKKGGILAYNMTGNELAYYPVGLVNNVDIRQDVSLEDELHLDILGVSNRSDNSIQCFSIDSTGKLNEILRIPIDTSLLDEVYGFTLWKDPEIRTLTAIVNGKNGQILSFSLSAKAKWKQVGAWKVDTQPEGMVSDEDRGFLYVGEEQRGIWQIEIMTGKMKLIESSIPGNNINIRADIEGLAIYKPDNFTRLLIASSQGNFSYSVFDISTNEPKYLYSLAVDPLNGIDGVEETDGLEVFSDSINEMFPKGIWIVQDGFNYDSDTLSSQNFKLLNAADILKTP